MTSLITRLEMLTGPDHEVDAEIAKAIGWRDFISDKVPAYYWIDEENRPRLEVPYFTGSLDAALTLVPEGCVWALNFASMATIMKVGTKKFDIIDGVIVGQWPENQREGGLPVSVAIAFCIAALKARGADNAD